jgi:predicted alpha/beta hydrolase family esterase
MNVFLIHGSFGNPQENWFPWLRRELERLGYIVIVPKFPVEDYETFHAAIEENPHLEAQNQTLDNWMEVFEKYLHQVGDDTIFVAHSIGPSFILRILERCKCFVKASIFVSGFIGELDNPIFDAVNSTFFQNTFDQKRILSNCRKFHCIAGSDDPYVPQAMLYSFAEFLETSLEVIHDGGHLNEEAGYSKFPRVLDIIQKVV